MVSLHHIIFIVSTPILKCLQPRFLHLFYSWLLPSTLQQPPNVVVQNLAFRALSCTHQSSWPSVTQWNPSVISLMSETCLLTMKSGHPALPTIETTSQERENAKEAIVRVTGCNTAGCPGKVSQNGASKPGKQPPRLFSKWAWHVCAQLAVLLVKEWFLILVITSLTQRPVSKVTRAQEIR